MAVFAASCDPVEVNKAFAEALKLDYPILSDPDKKVAKAFGVLSPRGFSNRWTYYFGENGKLLFIDKEVNARQHGTDVVAKLAELGVDRKDKKE